MYWLGSIHYMRVNRLRPEEVAQELNVSLGTVNKWRAKNGSCPMIKFSTEYYPKLKKLARFEKPAMESLLNFGEKTKESA